MNLAQHALNHIAIAMPDRESWQRKLADLQERGVKFHLRINHGVTHRAGSRDVNRDDVG
jgi:hypothetical protein